MKLIEQEQDGKWYDVAVHTISKNKFRKLFGNQAEEVKYVEIPLNDFSLQLRGEKLPFGNEVDIFVQRAIDIGAELLWIKKDK